MRPQKDLEASTKPTSDNESSTEQVAFLKQEDLSKMVNLSSVSPMKMGKGCKERRSLKEKVHQDPMDDLTWNIWPCDDVMRVTEILEKNPDLIERRHGLKQETVLHRAARYGNKKVVRLLLDRGATPCVRNVVGMTPLHLACLFNHIDIVRMLLEADAPVCEKDNNENEPIHLAAKAGSKDIISLLKDFGGIVYNPGHRGNSVLHFAAQNGRMDLIKYIVDNGKEKINRRNDYSETPLHLAAACHSMENNHNVEVIEVLLDGGAELNARTAWGDTAAHYAARWGTFDVLQFLCEEGISVQKPKHLNYDAFFEKLNVSREEREDFEYTMLQKAAKSSCIVKTTFVLDKICDARNMLAVNIYYSNLGSGDEEVVMEMNPQQKEFLEMSKEFSDADECSDKDVLQMFLKYCPDSLNHLFDRCVIKPCMGQVQGRVYFDFFLFSPGANKGKCASELDIVDTLITSGKERFLIHPIFEIFLKLKWYKTWGFYLAFLMVFAMFMIAIGGFSLAHFGKLYGGQESYKFQERSVWWYLLTVCHSLNSFLCLNKILHMFGMFRRSQKASVRHAKQKSRHLTDIFRRFICMTSELVKDMGPPVLVALVLYGPIDEQTARYCMACSVILICNTFMVVISRLPGVGLYVHMLSKVMSTVLNFFTTYVWSFAGYAIAFHILLPHIPVFSSFPDSFVKVLTMLMGEYDYILNFATLPTEDNPNVTESSTWMAKIIFVIFVFDMSVVLMNLVLGLAISDIEELQRNSAVRRMVLETFTVMFIDAFFVAFDRITGLGRFFSIRVTNERSCGFLDVTYLDLVDLDPNPNNRLTTESQDGGSKSYECPHNIVQSIIKVLKARLVQTAVNNYNAPKVELLDKDVNYEIVIKNQKEIMDSIRLIKQKLGIEDPSDDPENPAENPDAAAATEEEKKKKLRTVMANMKWKAAMKSLTFKPRDDSDQN